MLHFNISQESIREGKTHVQHVEAVFPPGFEPHEAVEAGENYAHTEMAEDEVGDFADQQVKSDFKPNAWKRRKKALLFHQVLNLRKSLLRMII